LIKKTFGENTNEKFIFKRQWKQDTDEKRRKTLETKQGSILVTEQKRRPEDAFI
jgi:hypothetical protein